MQEDQCNKGYESLLGSEVESTSRTGNTETKSVNGPELGCGASRLNLRDAVAVDESEEDADATVHHGVSFFKKFARTPGAPLILGIAFLLSLSSGSFVSIVPGVMGDRFARIHYGYEGGSCESLQKNEIPQACRSGGDKAQRLAAEANFIKNMLVLVFSSIVGSMTDRRGRKGFLAFGFVLLALTPLALLMIQISPKASPLWFYASQASHGLVSSFTIMISILSDLMPPRLRAPSYGLFLAVYMLGFAFSQSFVSFLGHTSVAALATTILLISAIVSLLALPETLSEEAKAVAIARQSQDSMAWGYKIILRPISELSILNRNKTLRLLAVISLCSGMIYSSDTTLIIYYMKNQLNIGYTSISSMLFWSSLLGVLVQTFVLKAMISWLGEKRTLIAGLTIGAFHNLLYGVAASKAVICVGLLFSELASVHYPMLVSLRSNNVGNDEQGHVQGAFSALAAIADAIGPVFLQSIYEMTKGATFPGPGTMFIVAAGVYLAGAIVACALPSKEANPAII